MSDQRTQLESDGYPSSNSSTAFSANGTAHDDDSSPAQGGDGAATTAEAESTPPTAEADGQAPAAEADAAGTQGEQVAEPINAEQAADAPPDEGAAFVEALSQAMQTTAAAEKARVIAEMDARREALIAAVVARRDSESSCIRELADDDIKGIDAWADSERERIQSERERRVQVVRADLELSLTQHGTNIDREIEGVDAAITAYRTDVEAFFTALERETPLAVIQQAGRRPVFPSVDTIVSQPAGPARAPAGDATPAPAANEAAPAVDATATQTVGVMDPESLAQPVGSWRAWTESTASVDAATSAPADEASQEGDTPEGEPVQVPVAAGAYRPESGNLVHAMPVSRPMSWLRRDREPGDDAH